MKPKFAISHIPSPPPLFFFAFSPTPLPPVQPSHSLPLILFPEVLRSLCCCVITADALGALFSSFPSLSVSAAHHASLCPPNAPLSLPQSTLGRGPWAKTKGRSAVLALRTLGRSWQVKRSLSFMTIRRALCWWWTVVCDVEMRLGTKAQPLFLSGRLDSQYFSQTGPCCSRLGSTYYHSASTTLWL